MRRLVLTGTLTSAVALVAAGLAQTQPAPQGQNKQAAQRRTNENAADQKPTGDAAKDEEAIRANVAAFVEAFNSGDSKAIAALFSADGEIITEDGESVEGREAIEEGFDEVFAETPQVQMEVFVESIRLIGSDLAVELGSLKETPAPGETPEYGRYTVLHVKRDGKWLMAAARDTPGEPPTNHERLLPLAWLLGEWIDDGGSSVVRTSCRWSDDENFLLQDISLQIAGEEAMQVTQRIGWDPLTKCIRSWVFDSEGGFGGGVWTRSGDSWIIKSTGVDPDGEFGSSTSVLVPAGKDGYTWRMGDRVVGNEVQPPMEVRVVRNPPVPKG